VSRPFFGEGLAKVARFEAERRRKSFPKLIYAGKLDAEQGTANYQAWIAIGDWLETGRSSIINARGGIDGETIISWSLLEDAARKELEAVDAKLGQQEDEELRARRDCLFCIHLVVARRREWLDETNRLLREQADEAAARGGVSDFERSRKPRRTLRRARSLPPNLWRDTRTSPTSPGAWLAMMASAASTSRK
jgi:hypothetical protein